MVLGLTVALVKNRRFAINLLRARLCDAGKVNTDETPLESAARDVRAGEARIYDHVQLVLELKLHGEDAAAAEGQLVVLEETLALMREHLAQQEQEVIGADS